MHNCAANSGTQKLPAYPDPFDTPPLGTLRRSAFWPILPYLEQGQKLLQDPEGSGTLWRIKLFISPLDPTADESEVSFITSYAANYQVFDRPRALSAGFRDGTSQTIMFAEHYAKCRVESGSRVNGYFTWLMAEADPRIYIRRGTFADQFFGDYCPMTKGQPPTSSSAVPGFTYQVRPRPADCNPQMAQTPHRGGMLVAFADGGVRRIAPSVSENVYWALVTPSGGETIGSEL